MIDFDEEALVAAQRRLGTATKVQTVNEALRRVAAAPDQGATARAVVALLASSDIDNAEVTGQTAEWIVPRGTGHGG